MTLRSLQILDPERRAPGQRVLTLLFVFIRRSGDNPGDGAELGIDRRRKALESSLIATTPGPQETRDFDRRSRRNVKPDTGIIQPGTEIFLRAVVVAASQSRLRTER